MRCLLLALLFTICAPVFSDDTPKGLFNAAPPIPEDPCHATKSQKAQLGENVSGLLEMVDDKLQHQRDSQAEADQAAEDKMRAEMIKKAGLTPEQVKELENASEAEQRAIIDKAMQQKYGVSLEELEDIAKAGEEGQKGWAQAITAEQAAKAQADPKKYIADNKAAIDRNGRIVKSAGEYRSLLQKLAGRDNKLDQQLEELAQDRQAKEIMEQIRALRNDDDPVVGDTPQILNLKNGYCALLGTRYAKIVGEYRDDLEKNLPDYARLETLESELAKAQTGVNTAPGDATLQAVRRYLKLLQDIFKYDLRREE